MGTPEGARLCRRQSDSASSFKNAEGSQHRAGEGAGLNGGPPPAIQEEAVEGCAGDAGQALPPGMFRVQGFMSRHINEARGAWQQCLCNWIESQAADIEWGADCNTQSDAQLDASASLKQ